ncbi:MAG TPA: DNA photolyase [Syntrophobacteraceae bacterium]|nr:DNA photolyase [Syntrophobacteraceae bacterium]
MDGLVKPPRKVLVEAGLEDGELVRCLRSTLPRADFRVLEKISDRSSFDPEVLEVVDFRGRFLKSCPGTRHYHCCGYQILHFGIQCTLGCSYCILQAYLNQPNLQIFGNWEALFTEIEEKLRAQPSRLHRIGTGEFTDSLLLDPWTGFSRRLVSFFARQPNAVLELKTKTNHVGNLRGLDHRRRTIAAWSLNAPYIRGREETAAASLRARLEAARACARWGYPLAFHFDPLVEYPRWKDGYARILDRLLDSADPGQIVWISLGCFRFMPSLRSAVLARHPRSGVLLGEFVRGLDGKMRYFRDIRVEMYSFMVERIRKADPGLCVYLCMEGEDIWREVFGFQPGEKGGLPAMLDRAARERTGIEDGASQKNP